jgi:hypothetical protein
LQYFLIFFVQTIDKFPPPVDFIVHEVHLHARRDFWVDGTACERVATLFWWSDAISACPYPNGSFLDKLPLTRRLYRSWGPMECLCKALCRWDGCWWRCDIIFVFSFYLPCKGMMLLMVDAFLAYLAQESVVQWRVMAWFH